jgi:hypothetical protein
MQGELPRHIRIRDDYITINQRVLRYANAFPKHPLILQFSIQIMHRFLPACLFLLFFSLKTAAQCPEFTLADLQSLQRATDKEGKIRELGFDLHSEFVLQGTEYRRYHKCWKGNAHNPVFEQVILWNTSQDQVMLLLLENRAYQTLRRSIEDRHDSPNAVRSGDTYIGKLFRYSFSVQKLDGIEFFCTAISFK